jgi:Domain of unknown function (DUF4158)
MPVGFLTFAQRERYGRYPESLSADELARYFHLDDDDREWIAGKRRDSSRLGYALQLTTARFLGTFLEDPTAVPGAVLHALAVQLEVADPTCISAYRQSEQRWRHTTEIRARYGYREFVDGGVQFRLGRWLCALCWTGTDRPCALFDHASGWLIGHKVLLPGVSILERFVAEVRSQMESRLWRLLVRDVTNAQRHRLDELLTPGSSTLWPISQPTVLARPAAQGAGESQRPLTRAGAATHRDRARPGNQAPGRACAAEPHRNAGALRQYRQGQRRGQAA